MAGIPEFIAGKPLAADDLFAGLLNDLVEEQKRFAVRDGGFDLFERHVWSAATCRRFGFQ
jgi:hypothetical protein